MGKTVQSLFAKPTVVLAVALMAVIVMMILPVPAFVLDVGLATSFALAILIFTVTLFVERPLDFSAFPTILLASLMLRLSLNISSTKLIIGEGHTGTHAAGNVIQGFADFVMGGNVFLGLVVFCVLLIVNFMVITKGAARMAEVGARFALDGMPGKQLAIDSDMAAGAITHEEARSRRESELQETTFFGSLDGASKFVKGDAVAGLLITLLNPASADAASTARMRCPITAMRVAEYFRDTGLHVLLFVDSITRFAEAHREVAVSAGEFPSLRGFPPSTPGQITKLGERAGPGAKGTGDITAIFSVLVAASDMNEPVADMLRGVLDGHVVLDRALADQGQFPAVDVLQSVSRSLPRAATVRENEIISRARRLASKYHGSSALIEAGLYTEGSDPDLDQAIAFKSHFVEFCVSRTDRSIEESFEALRLCLLRSGAQKDT